MPGGTRLDFDHIRPTTLRSFGLMWAGPAEPGQTIELRFGFSLRGVEQARANLVADCGIGPARFSQRRDRTAKTWKKHLQAIRVDTPSKDRQTVFSTALYHSLIKPCLALDESPFWPTDGPFVFDLSTMWDIYRTQLPLLTTLRPTAPSNSRTPCSRSARRRATSRSGTAWRAAATGSRGRAAPSRRRSSPTSASSASRASTGTGRSCTCTTTCAAPTARTSCCTARRTRSATRSTSRSATGAPRRSRVVSATVPSPRSSRRWRGVG